MRPKESECRACGKAKTPGESCKHCQRKRQRLYEAGHKGKQARQRAMQRYRDRRKNNVIELRDIQGEMRA